MTVEPGVVSPLSRAASITPLCLPCKEQFSSFLIETGTALGWVGASDDWRAARRNTGVQPGGAVRLQSQHFGTCSRLLIQMVEKSFLSEKEKMTGLDPYPVQLSLPQNPPTWGVLWAFVLCSRSESSLWSVFTRAPAPAAGGLEFCPAD